MDPCQFLSGPDFFKRGKKYLNNHWISITMASCVLDDSVRGVNSTVGQGHRGEGLLWWTLRQKRNYRFEMISITVCDSPSRAQALMLSRTDRLRSVTLMASGRDQRRFSAFWWPRQCSVFLRRSSEPGRRKHSESGSHPPARSSVLSFLPCRRKHRDMFRYHLKCMRMRKRF